MGLLAAADLVLSGAELLRNIFLIKYLQGVKIKSPTFPQRLDVSIHQIVSKNGLACEESLEQSSGGHPDQHGCQSSSRRHAPRQGAVLRA